MALFWLAVAVVVVLVFFALLANPVSAARLRAFHQRHGVVAILGTDPYVTAALTRRRRFRVAGVLVGLIGAGVSSLAQSQITVSFTWLLGGWFVGAVFAELTVGAGTTPSAPESHRWLRHVPYAIAIGAFVWTIAALVAKPSAVSGTHLAGWGVAGMVCAAAVAAARRRIDRRTVPAGVAEAADRGLRADAVAAITGGGTALAILYLVHENTALATAITGEEVDGLNRASLTWSIGALVLGLIIGLAGRPGRDATRRYGVLAVTALLILASGGFIAYYAGKGHAPYQPSALKLRATIQFTNDDSFTRDEAALGVTGLTPLDPGEGAVAFVGRVNYTVPTNAPGNGVYWIVVIDKRTNMAVNAIWGNGGGQGWDGSLDSLAGTYSWLQALAPQIDALGGVTEDFNAAYTSTKRADPLGIEGLVSGDDGLTPADLEVVMVFQGADHQIYWATKVPLTL